MKYICELNHVFEHVAKLHTLSAVEQHSMKSRDESDIIEVSVCPICETRIYSEYVLDKKTIKSVISVDLADVDAKLAEGYEVESLYAKTATLVKRG